MEQCVGVLVFYPHVVVNFPSSGPFSRLSRFSRLSYSPMIFTSARFFLRPSNSP